MAGELILYTNPMSRGRVARWMLEEVGQPYDTVILGYADTIKHADYLAINPMGKVPALKHGDAIVTECPAICAYLADAFPDAGLAPAIADRADYYRWLFFAAGPLEQAIVERSMGVTPNEQQRRMVGYGSFDQVVEVLDAMLGGRDYVAGGRFSAADLYLGSQLGWATQFGTLPKLDSFMAYLGRVTTRDAYKRAKAIDDAAMPPQPASA